MCWDIIEKPWEFCLATHENHSALDVHGEQLEHPMLNLIFEAYSLEIDSP